MRSFCARQHSRIEAFRLLEIENSELRHSGISLLADIALEAGSESGSRRQMVERLTHVIRSYGDWLRLTSAEVRYYNEILADRLAVRSPGSFEADIESECGEAGRLLLSFNEDFARRFRSCLQSLTDACAAAVSLKLFDFEKMLDDRAEVERLSLAVPGESRKLAEIAGQQREENKRRETAEAALRESEELHRVTLGSISDAVFLTDDDGRFTYVCPNVHVIFGYDRDEARALGSIDKLVGCDLFSIDALEEVMEIENIERGILDKYGLMHYLLINVKRVSILGSTALITCRDITGRKKAEDQLREINSKLEAERFALREKNIVLKGVLEEIDGEKKLIERRVQSNVDRVILPTLRLIRSRLNQSDSEYADLLERNLRDVVSPFVSELESRCQRLAPRELEICNLLRMGLSSKEIADSLTISVHTVNKQRQRIRKKLGLANTNLNLPTFLKSM